MFCDKKILEIFWALLVSFVLNLDNPEGTGNGSVPEKFIGKKISVTLFKCGNHASLTKIKENRVHKEDLVFIC